MKIVLFFSSGVASKLHKAKWQEVEATSRHIKMITSVLTKNIVKYLGVFNS
jgi:hypothetical protein